MRVSIACEVSVPGLLGFVVVVGLDVSVGVGVVVVVSVGVGVEVSVGIEEKPGCIKLRVCLCRAPAQRQQPFLKLSLHGVLSKFGHFRLRHFHKTVFNIGRQPRRLLFHPGASLVFLS